MDTDGYEALLPEGWTARAVERGGKTCIEAAIGAYTVEVDDSQALARAVADYERFGVGARGLEPHIGGRALGRHRDEARTRWPAGMTVADLGAEISSAGF